ncbi:hypothetical protein ABZW51_13210, partial [Streptomyces cellulosae]
MRSPALAGCRRAHPPPFAPAARLPAAGAAEAPLRGAGNCATSPTTRAAALLAAVALAAVPATAVAHNGSHPFENCTE